ncbi:UDP-N-acetylmuramoyl-tripeptide--D-alanyl-D-alanine ligase [Clostridium sp. LY3-2]|uniref:UDP-N-acetylmuramoyl-tripeptide--D-alanyl-D- alanine ligase n=1 Tax=Clostridium sp. LY3-2 TaxID=2942482 RepID=UPI0021535988|nr:UDP-N-acetylmuramoyl-tripeptide--D-alanyl-D-alanine ligase [Clostridium sp. LY3-2]MCR6515409.1 UDP-N-acetylmuramoyl-tripeptide--D-alanyl-D-alanine ligase [Clostridium sp. LY3-2]
MEITLNELVKFSKGEIISKTKETNFNILSTDTRKIQKDNIFLGLKGENFNGNKYAKEALDKGASIAIVDEVLFDINDTLDKVIIKVKDTKEALLDIAHGYREKLNLKVIGITGSTGKTSTKDVTSAFLSGKYKVYKTKGNFNNEIGLPLTILNLDSSIDVAVLEMGMSDFKEIHNLAKCARPDIALITNIGVSHIENLKTRDNILKAKMEIVDFFNKDNTLILNAEDDLLKTVSSDEYKIVKTGYNQSYEFSAKDIEVTLNETSFTLISKEGERKITLPMVGEHNVLNSLLGIAAASKLNVSLDEMIEGLKRIEATSMRLEFINTGEISIINDCYNASPDSMKSSLKVLETRPGRKVAILGTMRELGLESEKSHREVGKFSKDIVDSLIVCGEYKDAFKEGFEKEGIKLYNTKGELLKELDSLIEKGDVILVKASRGEKFEEIVEKLKEIKL